MSAVVIVPVVAVVPVMAAPAAFKEVFSRDSQALLAFAPESSPDDGRDIEATSREQSKPARSVPSTARIRIAASRIHLTRTRALHRVAAAAPIA